MSHNPQTEQSLDVYALVTNRIIELLESGTVPWRRPWTAQGIPRNAISKRPYQGINIMLLTSYDFTHNLFLTWQQIKNVGGSVLKGEKGILVVFTRVIEKDIVKDGKTEKERKSMLRYYKVFNIEQCKDLASELIPNSNDEIAPLSSGAAVVEGMLNSPRIVHKKPDAFYVPTDDYINMPRMKAFKTNEGYYSTLFHELIHSTGHQSRLARKEVYENPAYGTEPYSLEELVAEIGSCYLSSHIGIPVTDMSNNAAYIRGWLGVFRGDKLILIQAASRAQRAVEYILHQTSDEGCTSETEELQEEHENRFS